MFRLITYFGLRVRRLIRHFSRRIGRSLRKPVFAVGAWIYIIFAALDFFFSLSEITIRILTR